MLQPREDNEISDIYNKKCDISTFTRRMIYSTYYHLIMFTTILLTMVHIETSQAINQSYHVSPTPSLPAITGDERNQVEGYSFKAHNDTEKYNKSFELDNESNLLYGSVSEKVLDEARYNLATHVMSNGVELIIADEKGKHIENLAMATQNANSNYRQHILKTLRSEKPLTLAPSTLQNQMILTLPLIKQKTLIVPKNVFVRKICLTTYKYHTTNVENGSFHLVTKNMVITNSFTEEQNDLHASNSMIADVIFSRTPDIGVGMFPTNYHYFNTIDRGQLTPMIVTSKDTVTNTITKTKQSLALPHSTIDISPSTNTYFSYILLTTTVYDDFGTPTYISSKKNLTQVVSTEPLPVTTSAYMNTEVTKIVSSVKQSNNSSTFAMSYNESDYLRIYSTKALLETLTFCSSMYNSNFTILKESCKRDLRVPNHQLMRHTHFIKHIITDTVNSSLLGLNILLSLKSRLLIKKRKHQRQSIVTMVTLLPGEIIRVTGVYIFQTTPNLSNLATSKKQNIYISSAMSLHSATLISSERKPTLSTKKSDFYENFSNVLKKPSLFNNTDLILLESENSEVYIQTKNKLMQSRLSSVTSQTNTIEKIGLESFRPVLNVVAHLLKKQLINLQKEQTYNQTYKKGWPKSNSVQSQTISAVIKKPVYIPLAQNEYEEIKFKSDTPDKLNINSLHIYPPRMDLVTKTNKIAPRQEHVESSRIYENELMNKGIPIRPGEVITASANVIFGRPNINVGVFHTLFIRNTTAVNNRPSISLKSLYLNNPINSNILDNYNNSYNKRTYIEYASILKPPSILINPQKQVKSTTLNSQFVQKPIIDLNTAFYNHHILDIFRIPQIMVTSLPVSKSYFAMSNTPEYFFSQDGHQNPIKSSLSNVTPLIIATPSTAQQIKLQNNVISHTIKMHARPLTFKKESDSIPGATTVKLYTDTFFMPHIKIPLSDEKINVHITSNSKRLFSLDYNKLDPDKYNKVKFQGISIENMKKPNKITTYAPVFQNNFPSQPTAGLDNMHNGKQTRYSNGAPNQKVKPFSKPDQTAEYSNESSRVLKFKITKKNNIFGNAASNKRFSVITTNSVSPTKKYCSEILCELFLAINANSHIKHFTRHASDSENITIVLRTTNFSDNCSSVSSKYIHFSSSLPILKVPYLKSTVSIKTSSRVLTSINDINLQTSNLELPNSFLYNLGSLNTIQEPHFEPGQDLRSATLGIICNIKDCKNSWIQKLKNDDKMLEPSEMMQDDSVSQKSSITERTTNSFNTLQLTKTESIDAEKYIPLGHFVVNTSKTYLMKPIHISVQKVLISQGSPDVSILNGSDYNGEPYNVKYDLRYSGTADNFEMENGPERGHTDFINKSSSVISNSSPDQISYAPSDLRSMPFRADLIDSLSQRIDLIKQKSDTACHSTCRLNKNEICVTYGNSTETLGICECRPGFGRMFPDHPCKPTYTYEMRIQANWAESHLLKFSNKRKSNFSIEYRNISKILLEAADRMVMQSDYRDIFHGVQLLTALTQTKKTLLITYLLQLSENSNEDQLTTVFKKYLRQSNFSIGGTELYTSRKGLQFLTFKDFDECRNKNFYDCSPNAQCFNLIGSYTCSCKEGYIDILENSLHPGRYCLDNIIGCDKCNYNGKCVNDPVKKSHQGLAVCKCNAWYTGTKCQINLKIIILFIVTSGTILSSLVMFLFLLIITKRKKQVDRKTSQLCISASSLNPSITTSIKIGRPSVREKENIGEICKNMILMSNKKYNGVKNHFMNTETHTKTSMIQTYTNTIASRKVHGLNITRAFTQHDFLHGFHEQNLAFPIFLKILV
ncbi:uncharacterized protein Dyak_GE14527, isoform B [Drosophila yakuba]|uniref:Uncharacterized protein, isoform B n=1 Tax=Drosophila yakuba TaxID=7245 RepID=A0A0R1E6R7_DROYA|nr:uncharacterized protein Dyak_GE14527, isoform B [Drosophila yakuba]